MNEEPRVGDKIRRQGKFGVRHYGIYVGYRPPCSAGVVHNSKDDLKVVLDEFWAFSKGEPVFREQEAVPGYEEVVAQRALLLLGQKYNLLEFNCEHFVNLVQQGKKRSPQLKTAVGFALVTAAGAVAVALSGGGPKWDPAAERYRDKKGRFARK